MPRINEYPETQTLDDDDLFLIDQGGGTYKSVKVRTMANSIGIEKYNEGYTDGIEYAETITWNENLKVTCAWEQKNNRYQSNVEIPLTNITSFSIDDISAQESSIRIIITDDIGSTLLDDSALNVKRNKPAITIPQNSTRVFLNAKQYTASSSVFVNVVDLTLIVTRQAKILR